MWRRRRPTDDEFRQEIEAHIALETDRLIAKGLSPEEARRQASRAFGNRTLLEERFYERRHWGWLEDFRRDLGFAARGIRHHPGLAFAIVVTLALAIGANTAIFTVADEALFRPLPLPHPGELTTIYNIDLKTSRYLSSSYPDFEDYRRLASSFQDLAAYLRLPLDVTAGSATARTTVEAVSPNYFQTLELTPLRGTTFSGPEVMETLISERLWRTRLQSAPDVLGHTIDIEHHPYTIVGIVPAWFHGVNLNWQTEAGLWIPMRTIGTPIPRYQTLHVLDRRPMRSIPLIGRLKAGMSLAQAQAELQTIAATLARRYPSSNHDISTRVFEASRSKFWPAYRATVTRSLAIFGIASLLVLVLACANISNLLLERALARRREVAIRLAVGASRGRLVRQMVAESLLFVLPGLPAALVVGHALAGVVSKFPGALGVRLMLTTALDSRVLIVSLVLSLGVTLWFGIVPALQAARTGVQPVIKASGNSLAAVTAPRVRELLLVTQVGVTAILLVGCGLFARSLIAGYTNVRVDRHVIVADLAASMATGRHPGFPERLRGAASHLPGVQSSSVALEVPLDGGRIDTQVAAVGGAEMTARKNAVGPDFFRTMGIRVVAGREFTRDDAPTSGRVAIVNRTLATDFWPSESAIGQTILTHRSEEAAEPARVVGLADDVPYRSAWDSATPLVYLPAAQSDSSANYWLVRTSGDPASLLPALRSLSQRLEPGTSVGFRTMGDVADAALSPQRLAAGVFVAFGILALVLAVIGVYSLTAFSVAHRTREIGIRIALGAPPGAAARRMVGRTLLLCAGGLLIGATGAAALGRIAAALVRDVSPYDWVTFAGAGALLVVIAALAAWIPARRASRIDPVVALRAE